MTYDHSLQIIFQDDTFKKMCSFKYVTCKKSHKYTAGAQFFIMIYDPAQMIIFPENTLEKYGDSNM